MEGWLSLQWPAASRVARALSPPFCSLCTRLPSPPKRRRVIPVILRRNGPLDLGDFFHVPQSGLAGPVPLVSPAALSPLARLSRELQEKEKVIEVLQARLDAGSLTPSGSHALSDSPRCPSSSSFLSEELEACSDMDVASEFTHYEEKKAPPGHSGSRHFLSGTSFI